jgi:hypothetical protein
MPLYRGDHAVPSEADPGIVDYARGAGSLADAANQPHRPAEFRRWLISTHFQ